MKEKPRRLGCMATQRSHIRWLWKVTQQREGSAWEAWVDKLIYRLTSLNLMFAGPRQINYICGTGSKSQVSPLQSATCQLDIKPIIIIFSVIRLVSQTRGLRIKLCNAQTRRSECCRVCVCFLRTHIFDTHRTNMCALTWATAAINTDWKELSGWIFWLDVFPRNLAQTFMSLHKV